MVARRQGRSLSIQTKVGRTECAWAEANVHDVGRLTPLSVQVQETCAPSSSLHRGPMDWGCCAVTRTARWLDWTAWSLSRLNCAPDRQSFLP